MATDLATTDTSNAEAMVATAMSRQASEVQAAMVIAKKFPRDEQAAIAKIEKACKRLGLAEEAEYAYKRGGTLIAAPSIRSAEMLAQCWGNIDFGIVEVEQRDGESTVMSYAWDLESNTRQTKVFTVKHERHTKRGSYPLTDPRDIYEMVANNGARRLRSCILGVIPRDIKELASQECEKTVYASIGSSLPEAISKLLASFKKLKVTKAMLEAFVGHDFEACKPSQIVRLRKIGTSIRDGISKVDDWFGGSAPPPRTIDDLTEQLKNKHKPKARKSAPKSEPDPEATAETDDALTTFLEVAAAVVEKAETVESLDEAYLELSAEAEHVGGTATSQVGALYDKRKKELK